MDTIYGVGHAKSGAGNFINSKSNGKTGMQQLEALVKELKEQQKKRPKTNTIADQQQKYAQSLAENRSKTANTTNNIKKLRYSFKGVSAQILRAKTSTTARSAAGAARRETMRLRRMKAGGGYDEEELQAAIAHSQAMERVAKKKMLHLMQEEMIHIKDSPFFQDIEEEMEDSEKPSEAEIEAEAVEAKAQTDRQVAIEQAEAMQEAMEIAIEQAQAMQEEMNAMMEEMSAEITEMYEIDMEEMLLEPVDSEMTEADFKMLKIKHRSKENKEIAAADNAYLKVMYEKMQREGASPSVSAASTTTVTAPQVDVKTDIAVKLATLIGNDLTNSVPSADMGAIINVGV